MLKKIVILSVIAVSMATALYAQELENFDKGANFHECLSNCRYHHRQKLGLPHGAGRGSCWDICKKEHMEPKQTEIYEYEIEENEPFGSTAE